MSKAFFAQKRNAKKNKTLRSKILRSAFALALGCFAATTWAQSLSMNTDRLQAATPLSAPLIDTTLNEQVVMVPAVSGGRRVELETTIFKPSGDGPFPVVLMNHGKALGNPREQGRDRFVVLSKEFVKRGYAVVIPMRKGFSKSGGQYVDYGCNMTSNGQAQADDLESTLAYLRTQSWADSERVLVAGQSYGGLATMAFGMRNYPGVRGLINFAGGLKVHGGDCRWQASLVQAFSTYGSRTSLPSIWFYGANDHHFGPELAARMHSAYMQAGGQATLIAYGPFKNDAHSMSGSRDGVKIWWPETAKFLRGIGMPADEVYALVDDTRFAKSDFAPVDDVAAVPYLEAQGREQYRAFLNKPFPRAFAISSSGAWSWAEDGDDPAEQVLAECQRNSSSPCKLYAVDNYVVWTGDVMPAGSMQATNGSVEARKQTGP